MIKRLLAVKGIHYLVTRFGPQKLRSLAFDEKYRRGDWSFRNSDANELSTVVREYLMNGDLLIMGCGGASVLEGLEETGLQSALGIDLSEEAIRLAKRYASKKSSFQLADMMTFECPQSYDVILFSESLYYVPFSSQEGFLRRLGQHLKPNGVFIVTFAQAKRYETILEKIRQNFLVLNDCAFLGSTRHVIVFKVSIRPSAL